MYSSGAPSDAKPISCRVKHYISLTSANHESGMVLALTWENCAKLGLQNNGTCPSSSWQTSLKRKEVQCKVCDSSIHLSLPHCFLSSTHCAAYGSGVYIGFDPWRMYWVEWNTRKASPARKSREESRPATGRSWKPVQSIKGGIQGRRNNGFDCSMMSGCQYHHIVLYGDMQSKLTKLTDWLKLLNWYYSFYILSMARSM